MISQPYEEKGKFLPPEPQFERVDPVTVRVFQAFARVMHLHRLAMSRNIASRGVPPQEAFALHLLSTHEGITQHELCKILHLSPPRVSMLLRSLEESGAIIRQVDESDRRVVRVFVTEQGRERERKHRAFLEDFVSQTLGALPEDERRELERLLEKVAQKTEELLGISREEGDQEK